MNETAKPGQYFGHAYDLARQCPPIPHSTWSHQINDQMLAGAAHNIGKVCFSAAIPDNAKYMDISVLNAIKKWPDVPDVFGWLSLDLRGNWLIKGDPIVNPVISNFIGRNYSIDVQGRCFFQNGPQRVFVSLAYAPFVLRTSGNDTPSLITHTGSQLDQISGAWIDEAGQVILRWPMGIGSVSDRDLSEIASWFTDASGTPVKDDVLMSLLESTAHHGSAGFWLRYRAQQLPVGRVLSQLVPQKFAFDRSPQPEPGQADC